MALTLLITFCLALCALTVSFFYLRASHAAKAPEDLAQLVQERRPPVGQTIERWSRDKE